jgi:hypothetical protein
MSIENEYRPTTKSRSEKRMHFIIIKQKFNNEYLKECAK